MSTVKIGLDFGTHQTKICIEDASDKRNKRYFFHRFNNLEGEDSFVLPSLVQVNKDNTLSYGFVNPKNALMVKAYTSQPVKPNEPLYENYAVFPKIPIPKKSEANHQKKTISSFDDLKSALKANSEPARKDEDPESQYKKQLNNYLKAYAQRELDIKENKSKVDSENEKRKQRYETALAEYYRKLKEYQEKEEPKVFKYFKQTVFSSGGKWSHDISAMLVSIWYLTFIFFELDKKYGTMNLRVHFGTSSGVNTWKENKMKATQMVLTVYDLIENVFMHDKELFLSATLDDLIGMTKIADYSDEAKTNNAIFVFPEAVANLQPLAKLNAFADGIHLLVDIGGGTTDISMFSAPREERLGVYDYFSLPCGLNSVNEVGAQYHIDSVNRTILSVIEKIRTFAYSINVPEKEIEKIIKNRSVVFTGGGSSQENLCRPYFSFSDIIVFKNRFRNMMPAANIDLPSGLMHILSTALGLAMEDDDSIIPLHNYEELFHNVADCYQHNHSTNGGESYEHGLSDI